MTNKIILRKLMILIPSKLKIKNNNIFFYSIISILCKLKNFK